MNAIPRNERLLHGLRVAIKQLSEAPSAAEIPFIVNSANVLLDELTLRDENSFYAGYASSGVRLLEELIAACELSWSTETRALGAEIQALSASPAAPEFGLLGAQIERLRQVFARVMLDMGSAKTPATIAARRKLLTWETDFYARQGQFQGAPVADGRTTHPPITAMALEEYLRRRFPERADILVTDFKPLLGGFQKLTILFETRDKNAGQQALVLRGEQPDKFVEQELGEITHEFDVVKVAFAAGLPVAEPLWCEADATALGRRFLVSRKVPGKNYGTAIGADTMPVGVARNFVEILAQVHAVSLKRHGDAFSRTRLGRWMTFPSLRENTLAHVHESRALVDLHAHSASPGLERAYTWLVANVPTAEVPPSFLHGDYGPHNVLIDEGKVSGLLDWESARIGDPASDLAALLMATTGQIPVKDALQWYEEAGGQKISEYRLRYFEVLATLRYILAVLAAGGLYEADSGARNEWALLALKWMHGSLRDLPGRIEAAEALKNE